MKLISIKMTKTFRLDPQITLATLVGEIGQGIVAMFSLILNVWRSFAFATTFCDSQK